DETVAVLERLNPAGRDAGGRSGPRRGGTSDGRAEAELLARHEQAVDERVLETGSVLDDAMHHDGGGDFVEQHLGRARLALDAVGIDVEKIPAEHHDAGAERV